MVPTIIMILIIMIHLFSLQCADLGLFLYLIPFALKSLHVWGT